jgi:hypothetical protein
MPCYGFAPLTLDYHFEKIDKIVYVQSAEILKKINEKLTDVVGIYLGNSPPVLKWNDKWIWRKQG